MTRQLICCLLVLGIAQTLAFEQSPASASDLAKRPLNPYSWMNKYRVKKSHPVAEEDVLLAGTDEEVEKRARNPYAWTVSDERFMGKRGARNPYSWMNDAKPKRGYAFFAEQRMPLNPYSWMSSMVKKSRTPYFFVDERSPIRNPYSWQN